MRRSEAPTPGLLEKLVAFVVGTILLVVGFMFSMVLFAIIVVAGLLAWAYLWWKTRELRRAMRENPPGGRVIDGEVIVVDAEVIEPRGDLPRDPPAR